MIRIVADGPRCGYPQVFMGIPIHRCVKPKAHQFEDDWWHMCFDGQEFQ